MRIARLSLLMLLGVAGVTIASEQDVVNERVPVSEAELERHWQIDCAGLLARYNAAVPSRFAGIDDAELSALIREATLCGFVHNVSPSGEREGACPDYTAMGAVLQGLRALRRSGGDSGTWAANPVVCPRGAADDGGVQEE